jgi:hypothetical protein
MLGGKQMNAKEWFKWTMIFLVLGGLTASPFLATDKILPSAQAYSYDDAMTKIDWGSVKNNSILVYTKESTYLGNSIDNGDGGVWAIYPPCQYEFKKFISTKCFNQNELSEEGKQIFVFVETGDCRGNKWNELDKDVLDAYKNLRKCLPQGARHKFLSVTPNFVS